MVQKHYIFQNATCGGLLLNTEMFGNEIRNNQNWKCTISKARLLHKKNI